MEHCRRHFLAKDSSLTANEVSYLYGAVIVRRSFEEVVHTLPFHVRHEPRTKIEVKLVVLSKHFVQSRGVQMLHDVCEKYFMTLYLLNESSTGVSLV